jgi:hypothetical protein
MKKVWGNLRLQRLLERVLGIEGAGCLNLKEPHVMT